MFTRPCALSGNKVFFIHVDGYLEDVKGGLFEKKKHKKP